MSIDDIDHSPEHRETDPLRWERDIELEMDKLRDETRHLREFLRALRDQISDFLDAWPPYPSAMNFGEALGALHDGHRIARHGWPAECLVTMATDDEGDRYIKEVINGCGHSHEAYWRPSQADIRSVDWYVL